MGTTKTGRVLNTKGAAGVASHYSVVHSNEGTFTKAGKNNHIRLKSGGHGQTGMNMLDKYGIKYNIVKTFPNGVRVGNIPTHKNKKKQQEQDKLGFQKDGKAKILNMLENM